MNEDAFWELVEAARAEVDWHSGDESRWQPAILARKLAALPAPEIAAFDELFQAFHERAYRWDLWHAAYVIEGGCSDDRFTDFRSGLIALGRSGYYDALRDPLTLARVSAEVLPISQEGMAYAAMYAYEAVTGEELGAWELGNSVGPAGVQLDEKSIREKLKELEERFWPRGP